MCASINDTMWSLTLSGDLEAPKQEQFGEDAAPLLVTAKFAVAGMTCASCVRAIEKALIKVYGIEHVSVSLPLNEVEVEFDALLIGTAEINAAIRSVGYSASLVPSLTSESNK
jgi:copper chaperone CopZ